MSIKGSKSAVPDWVDPECWDSYVRESEERGGIESRIHRAVNGIIEPVFFRPDHLEWDDVEQRVVELGEKIGESGYVADSIVGVTRGGAMYMKRLAEELDIDPQDPERVGKIEISHYGKWTGKNLATIWIPMVFDKAEVKKTPSMCMKITGNDVLVADDDVASGETLSVAKNYVSLRGAENVKSAALYGNNSRRADFCRKILRYVTYANKRDIIYQGADFFARPEGYGVYPWNHFKK